MKPRPQLRERLKTISRFWPWFAGEEIERRVLRGIDGTQEFHELVTDVGRGFVLYPVADIVEFETPHETGKATTELFDRWIEHLQPIHLPGDDKGRLGDLGGFQCTGQKEIRFGSAIEIQATVKAG